MTQNTTIPLALYYTPVDDPLVAQLIKRRTQEKRRRVSRNIRCIAEAKIAKKKKKKKTTKMLYAAEVISARTIQS